MDFSKVVEYDRSFPVELKHPVTGEGVGITFNIVSFDSERVVKASKKVESDRWAAVFANEERKLTPDQLVEFMDRDSRERVIASIDSWDWGGHSFGDLGPDPECTEENKRYVIEHPNARLIRIQIENAGADLGNFSQGPEKPSAKQSKAK